MREGILSALGRDSNEPLTGRVEPRRFLTMRFRIAIRTAFPERNHPLPAKPHPLRTHHRQSPKIRSPQATRGRVKARCQELAYRARPHPEVLRRNRVCPPTMGEVYPSPEVDGASLLLRLQQSPTCEARACVSKRRCEFLGYFSKVETTPVIPWYRRKGGEAVGNEGRGVGGFSTNSGALQSPSRRALGGHGRPKKRFLRLFLGESGCGGRLRALRGGLMRGYVDGFGGGLHAQAKLELL